MWKVKNPVSAEQFDRLLLKLERKAEDRKRRQGRQEGRMEKSMLREVPSKA